jgi:ankyrin repeat protein
MGTRFTVEPLPPHPSLEHQQKLAKRLLREVWAGDVGSIARVRAFLPDKIAPESMKLHDAQLVVARGYGFESWTAMKRKIESLTKTPSERFDIAIREGDAEAARDLLSAHAAIRAAINEPRFDYDSPALHQAKKNIPLVDVLLEFGADINVRSKFWAGGFGILEYDLTLAQATPLMARGATLTAWAAAGLGLAQELKAIIAATPEVVRQRGGDGKTVLHCAATPEIAAILVSAGAELDAVDTDHDSTPLQYLIGDEGIARLLIDRGARFDVFAAARLGDARLVDECLRADPLAAEARIGRPPYSAPGLHIYGWTLGFDLTPADVARKFAHPQVAELLIAHLSPSGRWLDALWTGDAPRARAEMADMPIAIEDLPPIDQALPSAAAWWYRPAGLRLMLELGFDPHVRGTHLSTPLDRASFHGYADIVATLLELDPSPPLALKNEFGATPLRTCIYGAMHGWKTGFPQDHVRTLRLLLEAGAALDPAILPSGHDELDVVMRDWLKNEGRSHVG